jgi:phosphoribosylglycinamide formyltransferase 1
MTNTLKFGIIGSSGGSALAAANECLIAADKKIEWVVVTDRLCGVEKWGKENNFKVHRIDYLSPELFSCEALDIFKSNDIDNVILFYTKRVSNPLINELNVWNIHPSVLPSFKGLGAVRASIDAGSNLIGATLHHVDEGLDTGKIVAQVVTQVTPYLSIEEAERLSYKQKVWLVLLWFELITFKSKKLFMEFDPKNFSCPNFFDKKIIEIYNLWLLKQ